MKIKILLNKLKKLNLPKRSFLIYGSGPLGIRGIREIHDLDVVVKDSLYRKLLKKYPEIRDEKKRFIRIGNIELIPVSHSLIKDFDAAYKRGDEIDRLRFVSLKDLIIWKRKMGRKKDFKDIQLIKKYLKMAKIDLKKIKIRKISQKDLKRVKEFQEYINSLIEEEAMISFNKKKTLKEEREWLKSKLKNMREKKEVLLIAEDKNKIVGISGVELKRDRQNHVGEFGISIRKEYRGIGLGKKLMREVLKLAKRELKPKIIRLSVFSENKIAQNLYEKFGFRKVARIPKQIQYKGKLIDEIIMIKEL